MSQVLDIRTTENTDGKGSKRGGKKSMDITTTRGRVEKEGGWVWVQIRRGKNPRQGEARTKTKDRTDKTTPNKIYKTRRQAANFQ